MAFTHKSCGEGDADNQRLEFLGDSVLGFFIASEIYKKHPDFDEGRMTRIRAQVICESTLYQAMTRLNVASYLRMNKGEVLTQGRARPSNLADLFEALTAAIFLDGGMDAARTFVLNQLSDFLQKSVRGGLITDYKSTLQEHVQKTPDVTIAYQLLGSSGKDHDKIFHSAVLIGGISYGEGKGKTKKQSEQEAARQALERIRSKSDVSQEG